MYSFFAEESVFANIGLQKSDVIFYTVTDSTNTRARESFLSEGKNSPRLFVANEQTAGRGTRGRSFESRPMGLYFSFLFIPDENSCDASVITPIAAASVFGALRSLVGRRRSKKMMIKWVNDVYIEGRKVSGILCEKIDTEDSTAYVIGIGVNLYGSDFSPEVAKIASSIEVTTGVKPDKGELLYEILKRLVPAVTENKIRRLSSLYRRKGLKRGAKITVTDSLGKSEAATVLGLDSDFHLTVRYEDGKEKNLISGDVSIRL